MAARLRLLAKARQRAERKERERLIKEILSKIEFPETPKLKDIVKEVQKMLPEPKIIEHKTVQQIKEEISEEKVRKLIKEEFPNPTVPEIRIIEKQVEMDTSEFISRKEFKKYLRKIDSAIQSNRGGAGNYTNLEARVKALEELQEYVTFDRTDITFDSTQRTWDEE